MIFVGARHYEFHGLWNIIGVLVRNLESRFSNSFDFFDNTNRIKLIPKRVADFRKAAVSLLEGIFIDHVSTEGRK